MAPTTRSPKRSPFGACNRLPTVSEEEPPEDVDKLSSIRVPPPPPAQEEEPFVPTAEELAAADQELARMEAALAASQASDPISRQNNAIIEADEDDAESSEDEDSDSEDEEPQMKEQPKKKNWSVSSRRSSRRSSVQHLSARERKALKRLSTILRDGGESRRAQERRDSIAIRAQIQDEESEKRRQSEKKRRMRSIAKLIDLSLVWQWLERIDLDEDDDSDDETEDDDRLDAEAVKVVSAIAASSMAEALEIELGLTYDPKAKFLKPKVQAALRDLTELRDFHPRVTTYNKTTGFYEIVSTFDGVALTSHRSFRDLKKLHRGLLQRGVHPSTIPRLPRPRYVSGARKVFGNVFKGKRRGDRHWEASKVPIVHTWITSLLNLLDTSSLSSPQKETFYAGFCLSPAAEHIEDFLLKFANVSPAAASS